MNQQTRPALREMLQQAEAYLKSAASCKQQKVVMANRFANAYCQPHIVRRTIQQVVSDILTEPQLHANQLSPRTQYSNMLMSEISVKNNEANLIKRVSIAENNEKVYTNYALGILSGTYALKFHLRTPVYHDIRSHAFQTAIKDLQTEIGLLSPKKSSKIVNFPIQYRKH